MAGGLGIDTPFGRVYSRNITPDEATGIGSWSAAHFWRALHNGRSKDGRLLYPVFPYPSYTEVTRDDADAIFAYLRTLRPIARPNTPHELRFPYDTQLALGAWRALFFSPGTFKPDSQRTARWNRGAYLVRGLGHCVACHATRNVFGATPAISDLGGGLIPVQNWYAPPLGRSPQKAVFDLLKNGTSSFGSAIGPMAEVVYRSTRHLADDDLDAIAMYVNGLPPGAAPGDERAAASAPVLVRGAVIYKDHCATCHGPDGQGAPGAYPPLAGNPTVTMVSAGNLLRIVLAGGFPIATAGNPRPYSMPPFSHFVDDADIAAVASFIRASWGNAAGAVSELDVVRARE
jgi:mono/diheme cytochrome c family protein